MRAPCSRRARPHCPSLLHHYLPRPQQGRPSQSPAGADPDARVGGGAGGRGRMEGRRWRRRLIHFVCCVLCVLTQSARALVGGLGRFHELSKGRLGGVGVRGGADPWHADAPLRGLVKKCVPLARSLPAPHFPSAARLVSGRLATTQVRERVPYSRPPSHAGAPAHQTLALMVRAPGRGRDTGTESATKEERASLARARTR